MLSAFSVIFKNDSEKFLLNKKPLNMQWLFYFENRHRLSLNLVPREDSNLHDVTR